MNSLRQFFPGRKISAFLLTISACLLAAPSAFAVRHFYYPQQHLVKAPLERTNSLKSYRLLRQDVIKRQDLGDIGYRGRHSRDPYSKGIHPFTTKAHDRRPSYRGKGW